MTANDMEPDTAAVADIIGNTHFACSLQNKILSPATLNAIKMYDRKCGPTLMRDLFIFYPILVAYISTVKWP